MSGALPSEVQFHIGTTISCSLFDLKDRRGAITHISPIQILLALTQPRVVSAFGSVGLADTITAPHTHRPPGRRCRAVANPRPHLPVLSPSGNLALRCEQQRHPSYPTHRGLKLD